MSLTISVAHSNHDGSPAGIVVGTLTCSPDGGIHRDPEGACAELVGAGGDFAAADHESDVACPMHFAPVTVRATGWYGSELVRYSHTYGNSCVFGSTGSAVWRV
ncbi:SSI family serine proteinase inhibitor [Actinokineospora soli]|uniref:SSI family serine proteinase inhibitor n=1 Tax=Actinokineospora soli TaxID=1048753 RepID=A0ABW2TNZ6_9PSEU